MQDLWFYDGRILEKDEPVIRIEDRGYQFGDGVYDVWMIYNGKHFLRKEHLDRFERSCRLIDINPCYSRQEIEAFGDQLLARSGILNGTIYLQWTRGWQSPRNHIYGDQQRPLLTGTIKRLPERPADFLSKGCKAIFQPDERQHFCHIKTLNLLGSVLAMNKAARTGCYEAILVREDDNGRKFVTECAHSNCYAVKDGVLYTSPLGKLILPGITRGVLLELAGKLGIKVVEEFRTPEFYAAADEVIVSSASTVVPVGQLDGKPVGNGKWPVYERLFAAYQQLIDAN